jgi:hypothetical protein
MLLLQPIFKEGGFYRMNQECSTLISHPSRLPDKIEPPHGAGATSISQKSSPQAGCIAAEMDKFTEPFRFARR